VLGVIRVIVRSGHVYPQFDWIEPGSDRKAALDLTTGSPSGPGK
jgi:hypothetical protein